MFIEGRRLPVEGMHGHGPYSSNLGNPEGSEQGILYQSPSDPTTLMGACHGQPGKDHDRNRVGHVSSDAAGREPKCSIPPVTSA